MIVSRGEECPPGGVEALPNGSGHAAKGKSAAIAKPELPYPKAGIVKSLRPSRSSDLHGNSIGHINSGFAAKGPSPASRDPPQDEQAAEGVTVT
jgi:hypothetical protein